MVLYMYYMDASAKLGAAIIPFMLTQLNRPRLQYF